MTIREFVKKSFEYDHYRKHGTWGKYTVYHVWNKEWEGAKIGFPQFALVDGENIGIATSDETMKIMGLYKNDKNAYNISYYHFYSLYWFYSL